MSNELLLSLLVIIPLVSGLVSQFFASKWLTLLISATGVMITAAFGAVAIHRTITQGTIFGLSDWLFLDPLSAFHLAVLLMVFGLSSLFSIRYFGEELEHSYLTLSQIRTFSGLWTPAMAAMILVLISNNLGIMWVGMEATTLLTSFLICVHMTRESLEAMWKYLLICSVGIAFAFLGTLLLRLAAKDLPLDPNQALLWTNLMANTKSLAPALIKAAFIFALVGYGTKAGLAPMHTWLPDAHSKAPSPVSAIFSGFMLNAALYCIMRFVPIVEATTGNTGWSLRLLTGFGLFSILLASTFILHQHDLKRLLAYCSVEHIGIITLGFGIGGAGTYAALFHTLNHSLSKTLSFFAAGRLGQVYGTYKMDRMAGSVKISPIWGLGIFASLLALIGVVPFSVFMSEFQILKAAVDGERVGVVILFLLGISTVFVGILRHALSIAWGKPGEYVDSASINWLDRLLVAAPLIVLLVLGLWMPQPLHSLMRQAAAVIHNTHDIGDAP
ncbi:MAG: hydrogenase 4 subunit F [Candidatus Riflebacteria bacterium]|nr:hydrogenase 4 subunit F [Candidatus Riflebacteria bacterium]